jgi:cytochrome P450
MNPAAPEICGVSFPREAFEEAFVAHRFFGRHMMILSRPAGVHRVLVENADNYVRPPTAFRILDPPIGDGLFLSEGAEWRRQRRFLAPSFAPRALALFTRHVAHQTASFLAGLAAGPAEISLFEPLQDLALAVAGAAMFSLDTREYGDIRKLSRYYSHRFGRATMLDFLLPLGIPIPRDFGRWRFRRRWMKLIGRIVADRRARSVDPPDLFDLLCESELARGLLDQQVATMLVTGSETTGVALFWSVYLTATAPEVQERIAAEAEGVDLGPDGAAAALSRLVYTRAVVQEALRLYPPAFSIVRQALAADDAAGIPIPSGAFIQTAPWVIHRHQALWADPQVFNPERFMPGAAPPERGAYIPFGLGPRACIAAQFALAETVLVLAAMVRAFGIEANADGAIAPVARITLQPADPPPFRLRPRRPAV